MNLDDRNRYVDALVEQERLLAGREAERQCEVILNDAASRGVALSGATVALRLKARIEAAERVLRRRITAEKEVLSKEQETAPPEWRGKLEEDIRILLDQIEQDLDAKLREDLVRLSRGASAHSAIKAENLTPEIERLTDYYLREVEVLHGGFTLDAESRAREIKAAMGRVTISIHHSTVGTLNLGTIIGNIQSSLSVLKAEGHDQIVEALKRLAEEIGDTEELGTKRREALEQVAEVTLEAEKPAAERRVGIVRPLLEDLYKTLSTSANLIKVWEFAWPHIKEYFNLG
jgi:hypothetical protein